MKRIEMIVGIVLSFLFLIFASEKVVYADEPAELYAKGAVLMDADSGRILYGKNADEIMPMASTTKIMTLLITLENADLNEIVTVSDYAASMPDVQLNIKSGEQYYLGDLVYSMMLESHNDSAVAIAEYVGKDVRGFAKMMNEKAREIGCENTWYITPNGLDAEEVDENGNQKMHATTAKELALVMSYCVTNEKTKDEFMRITQTKQHSFSSVDGKRSFCCVNHNAFLSMMDGVMSGKTGYTAKAGYCYVCALENNGRHFVVALLACGWPNHKTFKWTDTRKLMEYGIGEFSVFDLSQVEIDLEKLSPIYIKNKEKGGYHKASLIMEEKNLFSDKILIQDGAVFRQEIEQVTQMTPSSENDQVVGKISIFAGNEKVKELTIKLNDLSDA